MSEDWAEKKVTVQFTEKKSVNYQKTHAYLKLDDKGHHLVPLVDNKDFITTYSITDRGIKPTQRELEGAYKCL